MSGHVTYWRTEDGRVTSDDIYGGRHDPGHDEEDENRV